MGNTSWTCAKCGIGNIGRAKCAECGGRRTSERMSEIIALLEGPSDALDRAPPLRAARVASTAAPASDYEEDVPAPRRSLGLRTMDLVFGLISAVTTIIVVVVFSFFVGIVAQAFL